MSKATLRNAMPPPIMLDEAASDSVMGRDADQVEERYRIYRLCECFYCLGRGKTFKTGTGEQISGVRRKCPECRGEGKVLDLLATAATPHGVGVCIVQLGREGEFEECPMGLLDSEGEKGKKWLVLPWVPSPRNVSDAARVLAKTRRGGEEEKEASYPQKPT